MEDVLLIERKFPLSKPPDLCDDSNRMYTCSVTTPLYGYLNNVHHVQ